MLSSMPAGPTIAKLYGQRDRDWTAPVPAVGSSLARCPLTGMTGLCGRAGDFWHVRGTLPVNPLNRVLKEFREWRQPTLMLVGNHDQVHLASDACLAATRTHACTPYNGQKYFSSQHDDVISAGHLGGWPLITAQCGCVQITIGGLEHGLTPLAEACPAMHVIERPTEFLGALWLPYRRQRAELERALRAAGPAKAVFAHADVVGAPAW